jgi:hypothetical protein
MKLSVGTFLIFMLLSMLLMAPQHPPINFGFISSLSNVLASAFIYLPLFNILNLPIAGSRHLFTSISRLHSSLSSSRPAPCHIVNILSALATFIRTLFALMYPFEFDLAFCSVFVPQMLSFVAES